METDWDVLATRYERLIEASPRNQEELDALDDLLGRAASSFPKDRAAAVAWFVSALRDTPKKWFVARILARVSPVPRALLDPLLEAALREPNPSANRLFIDPCVRTFGRNAVGERLTALAGMDDFANVGLEHALYWVNRTS
ncbi:hypothetical protein ACHZ97_09455 [Lysobacter soli]|uniref:hypothetical protein n=1 Tax=Lysobacter soli TaxID=453783 RepID=UPI0037CBEAC1